MNLKYSSKRLCLFRSWLHEKSSSLETLHSRSSYCLLTQRMESRVQESQQNSPRPLPCAIAAFTYLLLVHERALEWSCNLSIFLKLLHFQNSVVDYQYLRVTNSHFFLASFLIQHRVWNWYSQLWSKTLTKTKVGIHQETHASPFRHLFVFSLASQLETGKLDSSLASGCFCIIIKVDLVFVSRWKISKNSHSVHLLLLHTGMHQS